VPQHRLPPPIHALHEGPGTGGPVHILALAYLGGSWGTSAHWFPARPSLCTQARWFFSSSTLRPRTTV